MTGLGVHQSALLTDLALCVNRYRLFSPGWYVCVLPQIQLAPGVIEVPGLVAMLNYGKDKQCEVRDEKFHGAPNFVLDVFNHENDADLIRRRDRFCAFGVREYFVAIDKSPVGYQWYRWANGNYDRVEPDSDGILRSTALPDSWLPELSLRHRDWWTILGCIERGVSRRADFS